MRYYGRLLDGLSLEAKLRGIYRGLKLIAAQDLRNVDTESDTEVAMNLIKNGCPQNCPHKTLVGECRELLARSGSGIGAYPKGRKQGGR